MKNCKNAVSTLVAFALLISVSLGCRAITERLRENAEDANASQIDPGTSGPATTGGPGQPTGSEEDLAEKSNLYIGKCINAYSSSILNSYQRYTSWVKDAKSGPTGRETLVYGLYEVRGDGADCEAAVNQAKDAAPDMPEVEASADKYVAALKEAAKQVTAIYSYYEQEDYKDDGFAKGKTAHSGLMAAFEAFDNANKEFTLEVDKLEDQVAQNQLEKYRTDPTKKFAFAVTDFNIKAKKGMVYAARTEYTVMTADALQAHADELEPAIAAMKAEQGANSMGGSYISGAEKYVKAIKDLMRRIRDKKPFTSTERGWLGTSAGWMVEGSPDKVIHEYNSMIRSRTFLRL